MTKTCFQTLEKETVYFIDGEELTNLYEKYYGWRPDPIGVGEVEAAGSGYGYMHFNVDSDFYDTFRIMNDSRKYYVYGVLYNFLCKLAHEDRIENGLYHVKYEWD
jgi:hypothetical protein